MKYRSLLTIIVLLLLSCEKKQNTTAIAVVNGEPIYTEEVDNLIEQELYSTLQRVYVLRKTAVEELIKKKLIEIEARKKGITADSLLKQGITTLDNINQYVAKHNLERRGIPVLNNGYRLVNPNSPEGKELVLTEYKKMRKQALVDSLRKKYEVTINLEPPRPPAIALKDIPIIHYRGNEKSTVTIVEISDFECTNCRQTFQTYKTLFDAYKDKVKFGFTHFSAYPTLAAAAAEAAHRQNKFWNMHDAIFLNPPVSPTDTGAYSKLAYNLGLDTTRFRQDLRTPTLYKTIQTNIEYCQSKSIYATPTILINGIPVIDALNKEAIKNRLETALEN